MQKLPNRQTCLGIPTATVIHSESKAPGRFCHTYWSRSLFIQQWKEINIHDDSTNSKRPEALEKDCQEKEAREQLKTIGEGQAIAKPSSRQLPIAIVVHIFYLELWPEINSYLVDLDITFDLHITCCQERVKDVSAAVWHTFPDAKVHLFPNQGMDMLPFLMLVQTLKQSGYELACKLHTKRGTEPLGSLWRKNLLHGLIGSTAMVKDLIKEFANNSLLTLAGPASLYLSAQTLMYKNRPALDRIAKIMRRSLKDEGDWGFFAGGMAWVRVDSIIPLAKATVAIASLKKN
jgi:lipopolysaccharide biosynthesis protein